MARCAVPFALLLLGALTSSGFADDPAPRTPLPGESPGAARRLAAADRLAVAGRKSEAIEEYLRLLDEVGGDLIPIEERLSIRMRYLIHLRLAAMEPELLRGYRARSDPQARRWFERGAAERQTQALLRVVEDAFCSRPAEAALELLGDLAMERGDFAEAERWWHFLALRPTEMVAKPPRILPWLPEATGSALTLVFPDPQGDVARYRAKQIVARLFAQRREEAALELAAFRQLHAEAQGVLAGQRGVYVAILEGLLARPPRVAPLPADAWSTLGGDPNRGRELPAESDDPNRLLRLAREGPTWRVQLPTIPQGSRPIPGQAPTRVPFAHPAIVGDLVVLANGLSVQAHDVTTGIFHSWDITRDFIGKDPGVKGLNLAIAAQIHPETRHTVSLAGGRVFARMGASGIHPDRKGADAATYYAALDLPREGQGFHLAHISSPENQDGAGPRFFEGSPAIQEGLAFLAVTRFLGNQTLTAIECHAIDSDRGPRWVQETAVVRDEVGREGREPRYRHHLVTTGGPHVFYCGQGGAVVALEAQTGRRAWAARYPQGGTVRPGNVPLPRDLCPCIYHEGRLYTAPPDWDGLLCLDPLTGRTLWQREGVEILHLLGVGRGRLIFSTRTGLRAVRAHDGSDEDGWSKPEHGRLGIGLPTYGRGLLAGGLIFWPTADGVKILSQEDGCEPEDLVRLSRAVLPPGNMAYADGILAVADTEELRIYLTPARLLPKRQGAARAQPQGAWPHYQLAQAEADARLFDRAQASFKKAGELEGGRLATLARFGLYDMERRLAQESQGKGRLHEAAQRLDHLTTSEYPLRQRLDALVGSARLWHLADQPQKAQAHWKTVLAEDHLARSSLRDERGLPQSARWVASRALDLPRPAPLTITPPATPVPDLVPPLVRLPKELDPRSERALPLKARTPAEGDVLLSLRSGSLVCRTLEGGKQRWARTLTHEPCWTGRAGELILAAGPEAVSAVAVADGTSLWEWPAPWETRLTNRQLDHFHLTESQLFLMQGQARLVALDLTTGRALWERWAPAARLAESRPEARFSPFLGISPGRVVLQAPGSFWVLKAETGEVLAQGPAGEQSWRQSPVSVAIDRMAFPLGGTRLALLAPSTGKRLWDHAWTRPTTLTGEPPCLAASPKGIVAFLKRNHATGMICVDPERGLPSWPQEVMLGPEQVTAAVADQAVVYHATARRLSAHTLADGQALWSQVLPETGASWRLLRLPTTLVALPAAAPRSKFLVRGPFLSLELAVTRPPEPWSGAGIPVLLFDPVTGRLLQRLNCAGGTTQAGIGPGEGVRTWNLVRDEVEVARPELQFTSEGAVMTWQGQAWAVRRASEKP